MNIFFNDSDFNAKVKGFFSVEVHKFATGKEWQECRASRYDRDQELRI